MVKNLIFSGVNRDIKGANLLVDASGVVKLADFGMSKHVSSDFSFFQNNLLLTSKRTFVQHTSTHACRWNFLHNSHCESNSFTHIDLTKCCTYFFLSLLDKQLNFL